MKFLWMKENSKTGMESIGTSPTSLCLSLSVSLSVSLSLSLSRSLSLSLSLSLTNTHTPQKINALDSNNTWLSEPLLAVPQGKHCLPLPALQSMGNSLR